MIRFTIVKASTDLTLFSFYFISFSWHMVLVTSYVCSTPAIPYRSVSEFVILQTLLAKKKEKKRRDY